MDATWKRYRQASKPGKTRILDEFCKVTGYHRKYASAGSGGSRMREAEAGRRGGNGCTRGLRVAEKIWEEAGYPGQCG
jgi:hypothetical protein